MDLPAKAVPQLLQIHVHLFFVLHINVTSRLLKTTVNKMVPLYANNRNGFPVGQFILTNLVFFALHKVYHIIR